MPQDPRAVGGGVKDVYRPARGLGLPRFPVPAGQGPTRQRPLMGWPLGHQPDKRGLGHRLEPTPEHVVQRQGLHRTAQPSFLQAGGQEMVERINPRCAYIGVVLQIPDWIETADLVLSVDRCGPAMLVFVSAQVQLNGRPSALPMAT